MNIDVNWQLVALAAGGLLCLVLAWQIGAEWLLGAGAAATEALRRRGQGEGPPDRPPAEEAETTDVVDEAAKEHTEQVRPPEADDPAEAFEEQADRLNEDQ